MAISWSWIEDGYLKFGVDWDVTPHDTSVVLNIKVYRWVKWNTDNYGGSFVETLDPDSDGVKKSWDPVGFSYQYANTEVAVDTFQTRVYYKGTNSSTVTLTLDFENLGSVHDDGIFHSYKGAGGDGKFTRTWTYTIPALPTYSISYEPNGGSGSMPNGSKTYGADYSIAANGFTAPTNYQFNGWNTEANGSGDSYSAGSSYSTNANLTLYAQWKLAGPSVVLDANIYYNEDYTRTDQSGNRIYTSNNYLFPSSGAKASWTKFMSGTSYSPRPNEYQTEPRIYIPNSNKLDFSMRGTPYTHAGEFDVEFCGYYTGKTWKEPGIQVYVPKFDWMYGTNRAWATVAVPNTDYFGPLETLDSTEWNKNDFYYPEYDYNYQKTDDSDNPLEQVNGQGLYVPKIGSKVNSSSINLPAWQISGSTKKYTFYALWTKKDLAFTYHPNGGTAPENGKNIQTIGKPGPATEAGSVQEFNILTFEETEIKPPVGYKFKEWNTSADGSGNKIEEGRNLILGGYLNDVTLYAQYEQYPRTTVVLHANSKEATDDGPACFIHLPDNDNKTRRGYYDAGAGDIQINYRGQPYLKNSKFLGYEDENGQLVYAVDKRLRVEYTKNNVTYILNPARAIYNPKYFDGNVTFDDDTIPHLSDSRPYSWVEGKKPDSGKFTGYQWAYPAAEGEVIHLYARWGGATNAFINDNGEWKSAYIYINKNVSNPLLEPDWEQIDAADFLI